MNAFEPRRSLLLLIAASLLAMPCETLPATRWCDLLPRPSNKRLPRVDLPDDWFEVYRVGGGVFAICEPLQFQEVISYLILGSRGALLFDTGLGIGKIDRIVSKLTSLPVTVLNSHTHFDHVGGNADFDRILAMDTEFARANARGFSHAAIQGEVDPSALCRGDRSTGRHGSQPQEASPIPQRRRVCSGMAEPAQGSDRPGPQRASEGRRE